MPVSVSISTDQVKMPLWSSEI